MWQDIFTRCSAISLSLIHISKNSLKFFLHRCFEVKCSSDADDP